MRIIKKGRVNKDKFVVFTCANCGCEFSAAPDEYLTGDTLNGQIKIFSCCPDCHKVCATTRDVQPEPAEEIE